MGGSEPGVSSFRKLAVLGLLAVTFALAPAAAAPGAPTAATFDMEVEDEEVVMDDEAGTLLLGVEALLTCAPGFGAPHDLVGDVFVASTDPDEPGEHEAASDVVLVWTAAGAGSTDYFIDETIEVEIARGSLPNDGDGERRTFTVRFQPETTPDEGTHCRPDGYTVPAREESFTVTVSTMRADDVTAFDRVRVAPMVLAVFLVAVLALFAYRRRV